MLLWPSVVALEHTLQAYRRVRVARPALISPPDSRERLISCERGSAVARQHHPINTTYDALLQPKHIWRPGVGNHPALRDIAARIPDPSILQRLTDRQLFIVDLSRCAQRWQPSQRNFRDPPHWHEQEDQVVGRRKGSPETGPGPLAPLEG